MSTSADRPETVEEWYLDAMRWGESRYRALFPNEEEWEEVVGWWHIKIARTRYDPQRARAFTFLCLLFKTAVRVALGRRARQRRDMARHPYRETIRPDHRVEASPEDAYILAIDMKRTGQFP